MGHPKRPEGGGGAAELDGPSELARQPSTGDGPHPRRQQESFVLLDRRLIPIIFRIAPRLLLVALLLAFVILDF